MIKSFVFPDSRVVRAMLAAATLTCASVSIAAPPAANSRMPKLTKPTTVQRPALSVTTLSGQQFDLAAQRGKWVLVYYWATWCRPCTEPMPEISRFVAAHHDVTAIGVAVLQAHREDIVQFESAHPVKFPLAWMETAESEALMKRENMIAIPVMQVIGPDGTLRGSWMGEVTADQMVQLMHQAGYPSGTSLAANEPVPPSTTSSAASVPNQLPTSNRAAGEQGTSNQTGMPDAPSMSRADAMQIVNYRLTESFLKHDYAYSLDAARDPCKYNAMSFIALMGGHATLDQAVAKINGNSDVKGLLAKHGLTAHDAVVGGLALFMANLGAMSDQIKALGGSVTESGTTPAMHANVALLEAHRAETNAFHAQMAEIGKERLQKNGGHLSACEQNMLQGMFNGAQENGGSRQ